VSINYCIVDDRGDIIADNLIANPESWILYDNPATYPWGTGQESQCLPS
jgi:hypothetical protein